MKIRSSPRQNQEPTSLAAHIVVVVVVLVAMGALYAYMRADIQQAHEQRAVMSRVTEWPRAQGTVLSAELIRDEYRYRSKQRVSYQPRVTYSFTDAGGATHAGDTANPDTLPILKLENKAEADAMLAKFPAGGSIVVSYDPANPGRSLAEPDSDLYDWDGSLLMLAFGYGIPVGVSILVVSTLVGRVVRR